MTTPQKDDDKGAQDTTSQTDDKDGAQDDDDLTDDEKAALGDAGQRALERMKAKVKAAREAQAADAADAAEARRLREASKTDQQRREEEDRAKNERLTTAELKVARYEVAEQHGIPLSAAHRLVGKTQEELAEDAPKLKALLDAGKATATPPARRTTSDADKGGDGPGGGFSDVIRRKAGMGR